MLLSRKLLGVNRCPRRRRVGSSVPEAEDFASKAGLQRVDEVRVSTRQFFQDPFTAVRREIPFILRPFFRRSNKFCQSLVQLTVRYVTL